MEQRSAEIERRMQKSIVSMREELKTVRAGRASAALFDKLRVNYYGTSTPLNQLSTISVPASRLVIIRPWDKALLGDIDKAIQSSDLSLNPVNDGKVLRINIPPLTDERRQEYIKVAREVAERTRIAIRNIRRDVKDELKRSLKASDISEDEERREEDMVQRLTNQYIEEINGILKSKEQDIVHI